ncbi:MAG TPA: GNAT family N-acetyltransferase [Thermoplasmata archaeon]|jgi:ribosomal protein S18 acetylase RimI-like enzyme
MIRDVRRADTPSLFELMTREFPEESALLGNRPEGFQKIIRRVFRWDTRLLVGLLRLFGRPVFRFLVVETDGRPVASMLISFPRVSAYVSTVVVDPAYRRRGYARQMCEEARRTAKRAGRKYVVLDVLETNTGARTLYESIGYRPLRARAQFVRESTAQFGTEPPVNPAIRPFRRRDAAALAEILRRQTPPAILEVTPIGADSFVSSGYTNRLLASQEAAWVIDRGRGPEGHVAATVSETFEAGHMSAPVLAESVDAELAGALVRTAGAWCAARKVPRVLSMVADDNVRGRAALEAGGFRHAFAFWTLYRPVD